MNEGKIIEYMDHGKFVCAICLQDKGRSLHLLNASNREVNLSPKRVICASESSVNISLPREDLIERLRQTEKDRIRLSAGIDVKELWELVRDEEESFSSRYLAQLVFGSDITDDHLSALVRALFDERIHFKMKDGRFLPNSEKKVEQILRQREEEALREERLNQGSAWLKEVLAGENPEDPPHHAYIVDLLVQLALYGKDAPSFKHGKELLTRAGITDILKARSILIRLGIWDEDENLDLLRYGVETGFSQEQQAEASRLAGVVEPVSDGREDLRDLFALTIDGPLTLDFDDAVSLEISSSNEILLGIHIADVAATLQPGSTLDREASKRGSSLYLPRRQIPMIPQDLSHDTLSLIEGQDRPAVSLLARFREDGVLLDYRFVTSIIRVRRKLSYKEADTILAGAEQTPDDLNPDAQRLSRILTVVYRICRNLQQERIRHDALRISLPELQVVFHNDGSFHLEQENQDTPSRMIIAELMILYNSLAARFCRDHQIPALYRTQQEPTERLSEGEEGYLYYVFKQRRKLSPVHITTEAGPHSGLGLDAYIHATSPIRRYLDLVAQRQMKSFLMGESPVYSRKELEDIRIFVEPVLKELQVITRTRIRYWILKYLGRHDGVNYPSVVLEEFRRNYRIVLSDFFLLAEIGKRDGIILKPGEKIQVKVRKADPWEDVLKLEY